VQVALTAAEQQLARGIVALPAGACPPPVAAAATQLLQAAQQSEDIQKRYAALPPTEQASQMGMVQQNMSLVAQQHTLAKTIATWAKAATVTPAPVDAQATAPTSPPVAQPAAQPVVATLTVGPSPHPLVAGPLY